MVDELRQRPAAGWPGAATCSFENTKQKHFQAVSKEKQKQLQKRRRAWRCPPAASLPLRPLARMMQLPSTTPCSARQAEALERCGWG